MSGSIGKLLKLQNDIDTYKMLDGIIDSLLVNDIADIWQQSDILYKSKDNINNLIDYFNIVFFNKLLHTKDERYIFAINMVETTKKRLSTNANFDMCIDNLLLKIWEEFHESYNRG